MLLGTQRIGRNGHLEIGGCDTVELAKEFGTPLYVVDEAAIRANCRSYKAAFDKLYPRNDIYYASKAFLTTAMAALIASEGLCMDVASMGELFVALEGGFPAERIAMHGNNKSRAELEYAVDSQIRHIIVDNFQEIDLLADVLEDRNAEMDVLVRAAPGVDPKTHRLIRTGQADTKFGLNIANGSAVEAVRRVCAIPRMRFRGIHCHVGSQLLDTETHEHAVEIMTNLMQAVTSETGAMVEELNIGGGLGVRYLDSQNPPTHQEFAASIVTPLLAALDKSGLPHPYFEQEPGRAMVGEAGITLYTVGSIKTVPITEAPGSRTYMAIDGGMSDNPRPQLYEAVYECMLANKADQPADNLVTVAGKHCETDILIWNTLIAPPEVGDILAVKTTGAYNHAMASNYNRFLRPAVVFATDGRADLVVERETLQDLVKNERVPARLRVAEMETV